MPDNINKTKSFVIQRSLTSGKTLPKTQFVSWWTGNSFGAEKFRLEFPAEEIENQIAEIQHWINETEVHDGGYNVQVNPRRNNYSFELMELTDE